MKLFHALLPFMGITGLFILTGLILILITDKYELHLSANQLVGGSADDFFKYFTHVGDGISVAIIIAVISLTTIKKVLPHFVLGITTFAVSGMLAQFFKRIVFPDVQRPMNVFGIEHLNVIEGVELHGSNSFPSGHSTVSFGLFIFIAFVFRKYRYIQVLAAICAVLAAYSRVHISQHFIEDIVAGAILGVITLFLMHWIFSKYVFKEKLSV
jgi:membrane-associated phospholipid phosphatase